MQLLRDAVAPLKHYRKVTSRSEGPKHGGKKGEWFQASSSSEHTRILLLIRPFFQNLLSKRTVVIS